MKVSFSKLSRREKYIFYVSAVLVLGLFCDRVILRPMVKKLKLLNTQIALEEKKIYRSRQLLSQQDQLSEEHIKLTQAIKQSQSDEEEKSSLLSEIEKMARNSSVLLKDIKPLATETKDIYKKFPVEIEAESKIEHLVDFIHQLERSPRLLRVKDFYLTPKKQHSTVLKARMVITEVLLSSP